MKSFRILSAAIALASLILFGCSRESMETGIDGDLPVVSDLTYEGVYHGGKTVTLKWSGAQAVTAGATSFSVQFVEATDTTGGKLIKPDMYDGTISKTVEVTSESAGPQFSAKMDGQTVGKKYYIRVRANYEKSRFSEWVYLTAADGKPAYFKVGRGIITEGIEDPYLYKVTGTSTGLIIKWDAIPEALSYVIEYKKTADASWESQVVEAGGNTVLKVNGLPSETSYEVRAKTVTASGDSDYCDIQSVSTRKPGSFPKEMSTADEFLAWIEGGVVEVGPNETYSITADIDLTGQSYMAMDESMLGVFDGGGFTIKGVSSPLFYEVETTGCIKNVKLQGKIASSDEKVAAVALTNKGTIQNVESSVAIDYTASSASTMYVAGIAAINEGALEKVTNNGAITVNANALAVPVVAAGIAAYSKGITTEIHNTGAVSLGCKTTIRGLAVAGLVAYLESALTNSVNDGSVGVSAAYADGYCEVVNTLGKGTPAVAGAVAYGNTENFSIDNVINNGPISYMLSTVDKYSSAAYERTQVGGIVANPYGNVSNSTNNGSVTINIASSTGEKYSTKGHIICAGGIGGGDYFAGGGQDLTSYIKCTNTGKINLYIASSASNSAVGGIVGWPGKEGSRKNSTKNCINTGSITQSGPGKVRIGGIHGGSGAMSGCKSECNITVSDGTNCCVGGLSGFTSNGLKITGSSFKGKLTATASGMYVGGLVGNLGNSANSGGYTGGCSVSATISNADTDHQHDGMLVGYYNGTSASISIGAEGDPVKVNGIFNGTKLTASNMGSLLEGMANAASVHVVFAEFDTTPYDDGGDSGDEGGTQLDAPTNVTIEVLYNSTIVSWDAVEGAEWYMVEYKKADEKTWTPCPTTTDTKYEITGLEHGVTYNFRVKAFATTGSGYSDETSGETLPEVILGKPTITSTTPAAKTVDVAWTAVQDATAYRVEVLFPNEETWTVAFESVEATSCTVTGLKPQQTYQIRVKALGKGGNEGEEYSDPASVTTEAVSFTYPLELSDPADFVSWLGVADLCQATDQVTLTADLDLKDLTVEPASSFAGIFDGNGKTIKNAVLPNALFANLAETAVVKNLKIASTCSINWTDAIPDETGVAFIASKSSGQILGCEVAGSIKVKSGDAQRIFCAGVVGYSGKGYVEGCKFTGSVDVELTTNSKACSAIAGVAARVGHADMAGKTIVKNCVNEGTVKFLFSGASGQMKKFGIGGVIGQTPSVTNGTTDHGIVEGCTNKGNLTWEYPGGGSGSYPAFGGVAGIIEGEIKGCNNYGTLTYTGSKTTAATDASIGGVAGYVTGNATDCHNYGTFAIESAFAGGTALAQSGGNTDYSAFGGVFGGVGPFISVADNYTKIDNTIDKGVVISNCTNEVAISLTPNMATSGGPKMCFGGIVGTLTASMENCHNNANVSVKSNTRWIMAGGLAGFATANFTDCSSKGNLSVDADKDNHPSGVAKQQDYVGGLFGIIAKGTTVKNCQNSGNVSLVNVFTTPGTLSYLGGLMGSYSGAVTMENCSNSGAVTADIEDPLCIGGIAASFNGTMKDTKNTGKVTNASTYTSSTAGKESEVGGIAGYANATFTNVENSAEVASAAEGSFASGFVGGFGAATDPFTWTGTVNCDVTGAATTKASALGRFRNEGTTVINLGADGAPFAIKGGAASLPACGLANGNSVNEVNVTH